MANPKDPTRACYHLSKGGATDAEPADLLETTGSPPLTRSESVIRVDLPDEILDRLETSTGTRS